MFKSFMKFVLSNFPDYERGSEKIGADGSTFTFKESGDLKTLTYDSGSKQIKLC